ncbi:DUF1697 domain-containing protein [Sedimenticola hydrogenitrophicus]|uniref:DUF1697 domain-containing protein n=1 Tax=Sedimenticola hydrogenitrophicus TaxID=2967975 RepID=UPI0021A543E8|nr:DUF1697 domain-containing protein [Sedimenticola hydrogenitrophicus]
MNTYILLLRGINVGGRNSLPMRELVVLLEDLECRNVRTYIQSGNVVLQTGKGASSLAKQISSEVKKHHGFEPHALVLQLQEFEAAIATNPFREAESDPKGLHLGFLDSVPPNPDLRKLEALKANSERFQLIDKVFYLYAPEGVGRSRLAASSESLLGVTMTDRNWRTVCKIHDMVEESDQ